MSGLRRANLANGARLELEPTCEGGLRCLDTIHDLFMAGSTLEGMQRLVPALLDLRKWMSPSDWTSFKGIWEYHPLASLVLEDPFTSWSNRKPRGYAGDATLMDFIYRHNWVSSRIAAATERGRTIFEYTNSAPAPAAVRERRAIIAKLVDETARRQGGKVDILSVAAGHLREAEQSIALDGGKIRRWVALDQDSEAIHRINVRDPIQPLRGTIRGLLAGKYGLSGFDFIYSAGLYDYLTIRVAQRLTEVAFRMLNPGGTFLYANFSTEIPDAGYMETFMDWHLILKTEDDMKTICDGVPMDDVASKKLYRGSNNNIIYVLLAKKA